MVATTQETPDAAAVAADGALAGRRIVVTRPAGQAAHLAEALARHGARPVLFPVLEIRDLADPTPLLDLAIRLDDYDLAVFVSPNAVSRSLAVILSRRAWPAGLMAATMGLSSERELARFGIADVIAPRHRFDSEALLDLPELRGVAGKRIVIFRGDAGRELLGDTLSERGARVDRVACYRRARPKLDPAPLLALWTRGELDAVTVTSSEGLRNLFDMVGPLGQAWLRKTPLFVPHARIAAQAQALGLTRVVATGPADDGLVAGLIDFFIRHGNDDAA